MKIRCVMVAAILVSTGCGEEEAEATITVESEPTEVSIEAPPPAHEGTVVMAEDVPVEVVTHESGEVYAYVRAEEAPAPERLSLTVEVPVRGRRSGRPVRLIWNERAGRWEGRVRRVEIVPGPVDVVVVLDGEPLRGHADVIVVAPAVDVRVHAPRTEVRVERPVVEVRGPRGKVKHKHRRRGRGWGFGRHRRKHRGRGGVEVRIR